MLAVVAFSTLLLFSLVGMVGIAYADGPFDPPGVGYLDFTYHVTSGEQIDAPTGEKPESKLWWNDGFWWGSLYNRDADEYHIYRLNWGTQIWEDTGTPIDDRRNTKADVLWDEANNQLYVVSHIFTTYSQEVPSSADWGRLYRYSYHEGAQSYSLDDGFPKTVNRDVTETLTVTKDSTERLWATYVSRALGASDREVFANTSADGGVTWGTPFTLTLPAAPTAVRVATDDIAAVVAIPGANKIGIMWTNQLLGTLNLALHDDGDAPEAGWGHEEIPVPSGPDDHISIKSLQATSSGQVFAAIKTSEPISTTALIGMAARDTDGTLSFHTYSLGADKDTRPILLIDEEDARAFVFVVGKPSGGKICYKSLDITSPLSNMGDFPAMNCGTKFIEDGTYDKINNPTSTKQNVNSTTGLVVLASDDDNGWFYVHNVMGDPPPVVTARSPEPNKTNVPVDTVVTATFSKEMNGSTFDASSFKVEDSGSQVVGAIAYDSATRTVTFTPDNPLKTDTEYTVTLTGAIEDMSGNSLFDAPDVWTFNHCHPQRPVT
jgi:hypothetical protein